MSRRGSWLVFFMGWSQLIKNGILVGAQELIHQSPTTLLPQYEYYLSDVWAGSFKFSNILTHCLINLYLSHQLIYKNWLNELINLLLEMFQSCTFRIVKRVNEKE